MERLDLRRLPLRHYRLQGWDSARWRGFQPRPDDILVCTPYKAGTTWMQMICALLVFQRPELDRPLPEISPWMDLRSLPVEEIHALYATQTHRRFIKTHTALYGLPWFPEATYLCVERDPRDVFMSLMNHMDNANPDSDAIFARERRAENRPPPELPEDPDERFRFWLTHGSFPWERDGAPYWSVFSHAVSFWLHRDEPNILLVRYGDLIEDLEGQMRRIAAALAIEVPEALWPDLVSAASFESMKRNADLTAPDTNVRMWKDNSRFFHQGRRGQWHTVLSVQSLALLRQVCRRYPPDFIDWLFKGDPP